MDNLRRIFLVALLTPLFLMVGCAHFQAKDYSVFKEGSWQAKALVKDKKQNKSGIVNIKIKAIIEEKLRLDITSPLGTHLASIVMIGNEVDYLSVQEKILYKGEANQNSLARILQVPLDTGALYNILFDKTFTDKTWNCVEEKSMPKQCKNRKTGVDIEWASREGAKRTIEITHSRASVQMTLYDFKDKVLDPDKAFTLKAPLSFQIKRM